MLTRRRLLGGIASLALLGRSGAAAVRRVPGYGPLLADPRGLLDLPQGFRYAVVARAGEPMDDGLVVPGMPDGMHAFAGPAGTVRVVRNHELDAHSRQTAFDALGLVRRDLVTRLYDPGAGRLVGRGGTTTFTWDSARERVTRQHLSLGGTLRNCAGGATPHGSWLSCEESVLNAGQRGAQRDHGFVFEVPSAADALVPAEPLVGMGRFNHEAAGVDPRTGIVYLTEDRPDGLFYRFVPRRPGVYRDGGRLEALELADQLGADTTNNDRRAVQVRAGVPFAVRWVTLDEVAAPRDDLRLRGHAAGAARFARGEGIAVEPGVDGTRIWFACSTGGPRQLGQLWRYRPAPDEGRDAELDRPGTLELFLEPDDPARMRRIDSLALAPHGDLLFCEDHRAVPRLVGVTPDGALYPVAAYRANDAELTGATFAPDATTLFVNAQQAGLTLAISGPWTARSGV